MEDRCRRGGRDVRAESQGAGAGWVWETGEARSRWEEQASQLRGQVVDVGGVEEWQ